MPADAAEIVRLAERVEQCREGGLFSLDTEISYALGLPLEGIAKPYTASLDAAMTLLAPMWGYEQRRPSDKCKSMCWVDLWWVPAFPNKVTGFGQTPALALTAAALRARAAQHDNEVG